MRNRCAPPIPMSWIPNGFIHLGDHGATRGGAEGPGPDAGTTRAMLRPQRRFVR
jgi:hypothetical protein